MRHFTTTETQRDFRLVAFLEKARQVAQLDLVVTLVSTRPELDLFDDDLFLLELGLVPLLALAVFELAVIHDAANRRHRRRRNLNQIKFSRLRLRNCRSNGDDTNLLAVRSDQPDFGRVNFAVYTRLFFLNDTKTSLYQKVMPHARNFAPRSEGAQ